MSELKRHYEVMFLVDPNQSGAVSSMFDRYKKQITENGGRIHRFEDLGRRDLAYCVKGAHKAHYILINFECTKEYLDELDRMFCYNDAILRYLITKNPRAVTEVSELMHLKLAEEEKEKTRNYSSSGSSDEKKSNTQLNAKEES